jgi:hypothetical protein
MEFVCKCGKPILGKSDGDDDLGLTPFSWVTKQLYPLPSVILIIMCVLWFFATAVEAPSQHGSV